MTIDKNSLCICGMPKHAHLLLTEAELLGESNLDTIDEVIKDMALQQVLYGHTCYNFKLDNLSYIEQEAKKRKLI